jgi:hypothetical protein
VHCRQCLCAVGGPLLRTKGPRRQPLAEWSARGVLLAGPGKPLLQNTARRCNRQRGEAISAALARMTSLTSLSIASSMSRSACAPLLWAGKVVVGSEMAGEAGRRQAIHSPSSPEL